jgi:hypothetical protein
MSTDQLLDDPHFDDLTAETEAIARMQTRESDDAFVAAMARAIKRRRETASPGTFVDRSAPVYARRIVPEPAVSLCGSSGQMCIERDLAVVRARGIRRQAAK